MIKKLFSVYLIFLTVSSIFANSSPILSNFRIEDTERSRIYFDSNEPITGSSVNGFIVSGRTVSNISIVGGSITGHYFTVSSPFTFWDNNTIRYEGGSNIIDEDNNPLSNFTLTYIENFISEPQASTYRYVTANATGGGNGLSESNAWTLSQAISQSTAGQTIWVKAGDYGDIELEIRNKSGSAGSPIKFIGYTSAIGDITDNILDNFDYINTANANTYIDKNKYPVIRGTNRNATGIYINNSNYLIFKNIQIEKYYKNIWIYGASDGIIFDNCTTANANKGIDDNEGSNLFSGATLTAKRLRFIRSLSFDGSGQNLRLIGSNCLVKDSKFYAGIVGQWNSVPYDQRATDYYVSFFGGTDNIITNNDAYRVGKLTHGGHAFGIKAISNCAYNLFDSNRAYNVGETYYVAYDDAHDNVYKNNYFIGQTDRIVPLVARDGAYNNVFEKNYAEYINYCIYQWSSRESTNTNYSSLNNTFRNNVFNDYLYGLVFSNSISNTHYVMNSKVYNNTFYKGHGSGAFFYSSSNGGLIFTGNEFKNNIVDTSPQLYTTNIGDQDFLKEFNNWYNISYPKPSGAGNISVLPEFVNPSAGDFHLSSDNLVDQGTFIASVTNDFDGESRPDGNSHDIGAFEKKNTSNNSGVTANAGADVSICDGESVTLTASGGTDYLWSTGETTASITVNPSNTTTYSVTVTEGSESDTDDVVVTVNTPPTVDSGTDQVICEGESITLTAAGNGNFLWSTGETTASIIVSPSSTTTYTVTASNSCSTDASDDIVVTVNPGLNLNAGSDVSICQGESVTLTATGTGPFNWSTGETTASISVNPTSTTTYSVTSTNGTCSATDDVVVTVNTAASVDAGADQVICFGESVILTATGNGNFLWSTGETTASITVSPTATTTYTVTASNSCSTNATDDIIVTVGAGLVLDAGPDLSICQGETLTLTATGTGPFSWNTGETTASIIVTPSASTTYTVTSDNGTCIISDNVIVTVNTPPSVNIGADRTICEGENITLIATGSGNFLWSTGETTASITVSPTATTTYSVTASNSCAADATDEVLITVNSGVTVDAGSDVSICSGESVTLTATGTGPFDWSTGETTASISVAPMNTTIYTVTSTNGSCSASDNIEVTVNTSPTVNVGADQTICEGEIVTLIATGTGNFLWSTGETTSSITVSPDISTTYSVTATSQGCQSTAVDYVDVIVGESPNLSTTADVTIQNGESIILNATGNGSFIWSTGETTSSIEVSPSKTTAYSVTLTSAGGCSEKNTITVTVTNSANGGTVVAYAGEDATICNGDEIVLTASGGGTYLWSTGETERSITVDPNESTIYSVRVTKDDYSDTAYVKVTVDDSCSESVTEMMVYPNPAKDIVNVDLVGYKNDIIIQLYDLSGTLVHHEDINNNNSVNRINHQIDLSRLNRGVYLLKLSNGGKSESKKIIHI